MQNYNVKDREIVEAVAKSIDVWCRLLFPRLPLKTYMELGKIKKTVSAQDYFSFDTSLSQLQIVSRLYIAEKKGNKDSPHTGLTRIRPFLSSQINCAIRNYLNTQERYNPNAMEIIFDTSATDAKSVIRFRSFDKKKETSLEEISKKETECRFPIFQIDFEGIIASVCNRKTGKLTNYSREDLKSRRDKDIQRLYETIYSKVDEFSGKTFYLGNASCGVLLAYGRPKEFDSLTTKSECVIESACEGNIKLDSMPQKISDVSAGTLVVKDEDAREKLIAKIGRTYKVVDRWRVEDASRYSKVRIKGVQRKIGVYDKTKDPDMHDFEKYYGAILHDEVGLPMEVLEQFRKDLLDNKEVMEKETENRRGVEHIIFDKDVTYEFRCDNIKLQIKKINLYSAFINYISTPGMSEQLFKKIYKNTDLKEKYNKLLEFQTAIKKAEERLREYKGFREKKIQIELKDDLLPQRYNTRIMEVRIVTIEEELANLDPKKDTSRRVYRLINNKCSC